MVEVIVKGELPHDPRQRVLAVEAAAKAICQSVGEEPADAVMALLTAAAHLSMQHSGKSMTEIAPALAEALGHAIVAAADFYRLREALEDKP